MQAVADMIQRKKDTVQKIDFFNVILPFRRIEEALTKGQSSLLELRLSSCKIITQECVTIASSPIARHLRSLDLSCNPIKFQGLLNLLDMRTSHL